MANSNLKQLASATVAAALAATLISPAAQAADEVLIGASLPLSGPLAGFGLYQKWGYETAVNDLNKAGGLLVEGRKLPVRLIVRDDKTDPNVAASNTQTLITRDGVVAMLGSCTPALVNAGALVAERRKVPLVTGCAPLGAFKMVRKWQYAWALFFDEVDLSSAPFKLLADYSLATNKRLAILADNGPDGVVVGGQLWPMHAQTHGYTVVHNSSFPVDAQQFTAMIGESRAAEAEVVLVDAIPPQAMAIRKQMASAGFQPKLLVMEKGAEPEMFAQGLGKLAEGVLVGGYWDPSFPYPGAAELAKRFERETRQTQSQHIADSHAAAQVLLDAIAAAGTLDREKINAAIGRTDKSYVVGPVKFDVNHTSRIPITLMQWQGGKPVVVWPKDRANGKLIFPLPVAQ
ncbi:amino acid ABC transporter substrate-binding protein [Ideonella livida]|uniref:ABC transporter substrate-binding protein n=1 Tax=Ideonella livida TaxID=2707176 RepID=A0A7C9TN81_9BURK|nr:amino acid ABC transporter substrate-binding protein [Ideonella livida]NDY93225.1 ABC transporter substrate-binding protein [Ideonella livida]